MPPPFSTLSLWTRDVTTDIQSAGSTFTSWDKCMSKSYCKWPVIVAIIVGSVIVIGILGCIINCLFCGYRCCTCCCGCCCPSGNRKNKKPKYYDEPPYSQPGGPAPSLTYQQPTTAPPPVYRGAVQTATFDTSKSPAHVNEDALPEMPTWANAVDKRIEDDSHRDDVEMEPLNPHGQTPDRKQGNGMPMNPGAAYSDYPPDRGTPNTGYRGFGPTDPYARRSPASAAAFAAQDPYGRRSPGPAAAYAAAHDPYPRRSPGPGAALAAAHDPYGRHSLGMTPSVADGSSYDHQPYHQQSYGHQSYDDHGHNGTGTGYHAVTSPSPVAAYKPNTNYSSLPMTISPTSESGYGQSHPTADFQRQPSFGSSQYPPTYTSQPSYRGMGSATPPFQAPSPSEYTTHQYGVSDPGHDRPPGLLQSGRNPPPNSYRDI